MVLTPPNPLVPSEEVVIETLNEEELYSEGESFEEVLKEIESHRTANQPLVGVSSPTHSVAVLSVPSPTQVRKSMRLLKIQGLNTSVLSMAMKRAREKHLEEVPLKGNSLLDAFPFNRLPNADIAALFDVYKITLGNSDTQRDFIIETMRNSPRSSFEVVITQALALTKESSHSVLLDTNMGITCLVK